MSCAADVFEGMTGDGGSVGGAAKETGGVQCGGLGEDNGRG